MNLRNKTLVITLVATMLLLVSTGFISSWLVMRGFSKIEDVSMARDIARARDVLQNDINDLASKVADWAVWDDSYQFISDGNTDFIASNLEGSVFSDLQLSAVIFIDTNGRIVYSQGFDLEKNIREQIPDDLALLVRENSYLTAHTDWTDTKRGIVMLQNGPMMIVSRPIVTSLGQGPIRGTVVFARELSQKEIARFSQVIHLDIALIPVSGLIDNAITKKSLAQISGVAVVSDIFGNPAFGLRVTTLRDIYGQGLTSLRVFLVALLFAISGFSIMLFFALRWLIISRITSLSNQVEVIGSQKNFSKRVSLSKTTDEIGDLAFAFNTTLDAFEKSRALLAEAKAKDDAILASMGEGVIVANKKGLVVYWNDEAKKLLGIDMKSKQKSAPYMHPLVDPNTGKPFPKTKTPLMRALRGESVYKTEVLIRRGTSGKDIHASANGRPVKNAQGGIIGAVVTVRDISKEKEVDKAKTEFVSLASHQLRTPLSAISWYLEMLSSGDVGKLTKQQKQYINEAYAGNIRMGELVDSLLNVSRLELGTFSINPEATDILKLTQSVIAEMKPLFRKKQQTIHVHCTKKIPTLMLDQKLVRMVIQNLVSNAVKYTPVNGAVSLEFSHVDKESIFHGKKIPVPSIGFSVHDNGIGIPKKDQEKIFSKLFRAENALGVDTEGTGLGLYIVKSVIEASGGTVWFESEEHKGTTFFVTIPTDGMQKRTGTKALI